MLTVFIIAPQKGISQIIERILNGEKSFYELIVRRYNPNLYKVGRSYNYNHEDTQDLMQDTYIDAYKSLAQFEGRSNFKHGLFGLWWTTVTGSEKNQVLKWNYERHKWSIKTFVFGLDKDTHKNRSQSGIRKCYRKSASEYSFRLSHGVFT